MSLSPTLAFDENYSSTRYFLLELSPQLLTEFNENLPSISIKGAEGHDAFFITPNHTLKVKECEYSNSDLIVNPSDPSFYKVCASLNCILELVPTLPHLTEIHSYGLSVQYDSPAFDCSAARSSQSLLDSCCCSHVDFLAHLKEHKYVVCSNSGPVNLLYDPFSHFDPSIAFVKPSLSYTKFLLEQVIFYCIEKELNDLVIDLSFFLEELSDHNGFIVSQIIKSYSLNTLSSSVLQLCPVQLARHRALLLFDDCTKLNLEVFMEKWCDSVSDLLELIPNFELNMSSLIGSIVKLPVIDQGQVLKEFAVFFPIDLLSTDPGTRFSQLFKLKDQWSLEELEVYIRPLCREYSFDSLLVKYARKVIGVDSPVFSKR
ncbi:hypothetical protein RCL1_001359 [Eukaryota sp. TZLM3-RCL]